MNERKFSFFTELKRRHVDKVALVCAVVAWLLIEIAWIVLPTFDAPAWILKAFIILLVLGFIFAVTISWSFEMTPEGMNERRTFRRARSFLTGANGSLPHSLSPSRSLRLGCLFTSCCGSRRPFNRCPRRNGPTKF